MRSKLPLALVGLIAIGCDSMAPPADLQGTWASSFTIPGPSLVITLSQAGDTITGSGTYVIEAGGSGKLQVNGVYTRPAIALTLRYDNGIALTYQGTVTDAQHMNGTMADNAGGTFSQTLVRQ